MNFCDLSGQTALVTGSSRGIGKSIAMKLQQAGAYVILSGSNDKLLHKTSQEFNNAHCITADLFTSEGIKFLAEQAGNVDILVNNAGITADGLFARQTEEQWNNVMQINLNATVELTRLMLPAMSKKKFGRIINISSVVAHSGNIGQTNYITSKAAIEGFTKGLSKEVARRGVTVNSVAPGLIASDMTKKMPEKNISQMLKQIPMRRFGQPEEVANAVLFLAGKESSFITGTTLHLNGGMYV